MKTLTSGPGIVFTFKDLNECIHDFCAEMMLNQVKLLNSRSNHYLAQISQLNDVIHFKNLKINSLKLRCAHVYDNMQRITNSKVSEQGNTLVFALDRAMREVRFYQDHIKCYEKEMRKAVHEQFRELLDKQQRTISSKDK